MKKYKKMLRSLANTSL